MDSFVDGRRYTLLELAHCFGVGQDRVTEILQSAKRKLEPPSP